MDLGTRCALAYALSSAAGLRGLLTLLAVAVAAHAGYVHPAPALAWIESDGALRILVAGAVIELVADKVPFVDHLVHAVQLIAKPLAGALVAGDAVALPAGTPALDAVMGVGAANALVLHVASASVRGASTVTSGGLANPVLSLVEDALAVATIVAAFLAPVLAALVALALLVTFVVLARRVHGVVVARLARRRAAAAARSAPRGTETTLGGR